MLQLFDYDLDKPQSQDYEALQDSVAQAGGGIHVFNSFWLCGGDHSAGSVLDAAYSALGAGRHHKLLVFPVEMGELSTGRSPDKEPIQDSPGEDVIAVACTMRSHRDCHWDKVQADKRRDELVKALKTLDSKLCHPLESLWFIRTGLPAHEVHRALEKAVPLTRNDAWVVAKVGSLDGGPVKGAEKGLEEEHRAWLEKAGVLEAKPADYVPASGSGAKISSMGTPKTRARRKARGRLGS